MPNSKPETPQLYLFLSVDIIGSTQLKYDPKKPINWFNSFKAFYISFPDELKSNLKSTCAWKKLTYNEENLVVWKYAGDEILLFSTITQQNEVPCILLAFKRTLEDWLAKSLEKLQIKGSAWIGQVPFIDRKITNIKKNTNNELPDFIGPSIDCGFRIGKYSSQMEISISIEVADLCNKFPDLQHCIYYKRSENLKGVFGNSTEYPIFVIKLEAENSPKEYSLLQSCNEQLLDEYIDAYYKKLRETYSEMISRIKPDIPNYLETKKEVSRKIIANDTDIKPQISAKEVSGEVLGDDASFNAIQSEIKSLPRK